MLKLQLDDVVVVFQSWFHIRTARKPGSKHKYVTFVKGKRLAGHHLHKDMKEQVKRASFHLLQGFAIVCGGGGGWWLMVGCVVVVVAGG